MKKNKVLSVFLFSLLLGFGYSQNLSGDSINESITMKGQLERINQIKMFFCNDGLEPDKLKKILDIESRPGENQEMCMILLNIGKEDQDLVVGFSEGLYNNAGQKICDQDMGPKNKFSKLFYGSSLDGENNININLKGGEKKLIKTKISIPKNSSGEMIGCVSYKIKGDISRGSGSVFDVLIRKSSPIEIKISGKVYKYGRIDRTKENIKKNKIIILKILTGIIGIRLIYSIVQSGIHKKQNKKGHKHK